MASHNQRDANERFVLPSRPRPVEKKNICTDPGHTSELKPGKYGNIMYDRRVVRGNTYAQNLLPITVSPDAAEAQRQQELWRREMLRRKEQARLRCPRALLGRKHMDVQTEAYLEELSNIIVSADIESQTDAFLDRPASPLFIPHKSGKDVATEILERELFDFDREVQPMVEVLVGKTIEQSLLDVMEEDELESLRVQQKAFWERRNAELAQVQQQQEQERRYREEKERRIVQHREALRLQRETAEKIAAHMYARQYLTDLLPSVFTSLRRHGFFYDRVERDVESTSLPWLMTEVTGRLQERNMARELVDYIIYEAVQRKMQLSTDQEPKEEQSGSVTDI